nr:MAG: hypothetical protein [Bacteriophage sp.]
MENVNGIRINAKIQIMQITMILEINLMCVVIRKYHGKKENLNAKKENGKTTRNMVMMIYIDEK